MKLTTQEEKTIRVLLKDNSKSKFHKRLQILLFRSKGKQYKEITELLDCNKSTITRTVLKFKEKGLEALLRETRGGRNRQYLSHEEEAAFLGEQLAPSLTGDFVTIDQLFQAYQDKVGKETTREGVYALLKRHGWRKVTPRPEHPKKAEAQTIVASKNKIYVQEEM